jgi:DNA-binding transcriptional LysR family regulator
VAIERGETKTVRFGWAALADPHLFREFSALHRAMLPSYTIRPSYGDTVALAKEIVAGHLDAAIVTLPLANPELHIELLRRDRLVVCIRQDDPRGSKATLRASDLQHTPVVLYHPERHPDAHDKLAELLLEKGISIEEYARASHPSEIQSLVRDGYGFALIREGTELQEQLTTRPLAGVDWTVDTVVIYHKIRHPKTVPLVVKQLKRRQQAETRSVIPAQPTVSESISAGLKRPPQSVRPATQQ